MFNFVVVTQIIVEMIKENATITSSLKKILEHSLFSGIVGAIIAAFITVIGTICIQKKLITHERKSRFKIEQVKALAHIKQKFNHSHYHYEDKDKRKFLVEVEKGTEIISELNHYYIYLPVKVTEKLDEVIDFESRELHDGFPDDESKVIYSKMLSDLVNSVLQEVPIEYEKLKKEVVG